ncbi:anti-sigma regulatory factor [Chlorogloea sp. CCALA 695]|uniref:anti-sigma regulatory factor n=1 Tax=Chlorogloea sp. CCALA 695 TaxID=2107693 RepID=UPI000D074254|nr:anti-sigma regulatory factor [Chlorogloea sp. CCALA 695]PSB34233.1 anti-sigma regulatory factor [Chlorogloea sp. CCALA 695]
MAAPEGQKQEIDIYSSSDIVLVRKIVRTWAVELGFSLVDQTKIITASSELARNTLTYGGGGTLTLEVIEVGYRQGLRLIFSDQGAGISDIELALKDGYTTGGGLGMGLSGTKRLMSEFEISSRVGEGTQVKIIKWK